MLNKGNGLAQAEGEEGMLSKSGRWMVALVLACGGVASAAPLNLDNSDFVADIDSFFVAVSYDAGADQFTGSGSAASLTLKVAPVGVYSITGGTFAISAPVDGTGALLGGGTVTIGGTIPALSANSGTLVVGDLTAFGFLDPPNGGEIFEFTFSPTSGDLVTQGYFPSDSTCGVILDAVDSGFAGSFAGRFSNSGFGNADTYYVPEPATVGLLLVGGVAAVCRRRRRSA